MDEQNKVLPKEAVVSHLEEVVEQTTQELERDYLPQLKHGETKRLFMAVTKYPKEETEFSIKNNDSPALIRAYSLSKQIKDALAGLAVEVVIEKLIKDQQAAQEEAKENEDA